MLANGVLLCYLLANRDTPIRTRFEAAAKEPQKLFALPGQHILERDREEGVAELCGVVCIPEERVIRVIWVTQEPYVPFYAAAA
jgi:hypothetical protein